MQSQGLRRKGSMIAGDCKNKWVHTHRVLIAKWGAELKGARCPCFIMISGRVLKHCEKRKDEKAWFCLAGLGASRESRQMNCPWQVGWIFRHLSACLYSRLGKFCSTVPSEKNKLFLKKDKGDSFMLLFHFLIWSQWLILKLNTYLESHWDENRSFDAKLIQDVATNPSHTKMYQPHPVNFETFHGKQGLESQNTYTL